MSILLDMFLLCCHLSLSLSFHSLQWQILSHYLFLCLRQDAGLPFKKGDILTIMNQEDSFWWQAIRYGEHDLAKLIPSQMLEERYASLSVPSLSCSLLSLFHPPFFLSLSQTSPNSSPVRCWRNSRYYYVTLS